MDLSSATWRKSSRSGANANNCVEVATDLPHVVGIRDSKDRSGPALTVPHTAWTSFITAIKGERFDR